MSKEGLGRREFLKGAAGAAGVVFLPDIDTGTPIEASKTTEFVDGKRVDRLFQDSFDTIQAIAKENSSGLKASKHDLGTKVADSFKDPQIRLDTLEDPKNGDGVAAITEVFVTVNERAGGYRAHLTRSGNEFMITEEATHDSAPQKNEGLTLTGIFNTTMGRNGAAGERTFDLNDSKISGPLSTSHINATRGRVMSVLYALQNGESLPIHASLK